MHKFTSVLAARRRQERKWRSQGIDPVAARMALITFDGVCPSCGRIENHGRAWHVDHDHATGIVRGILCFNCNVTQGLLGDDPAKLKIVIAERKAQRGHA